MHVECALALSESAFPVAIEAMLLNAMEDSERYSAKGKERRASKEHERLKDWVMVEG